MFDIYNEVKDATSIGISGHIKPDGDCIGSCLGMFHYLRKTFPDKKVIVYLEEPNWVFKDIPGYKSIKQCINTNEIYDVFISIDTTPGRMGAATEAFNKAKKKINIDHHITNPDGEGDVNYTVPGASSASELVYDLIPKDALDANIAEALYMGIVHDTGVFRYSNVRPSTLLAAAKLLEYGFNASEMIDYTFYEKTLEQNRAQGHIVIDSRLYNDNKLIVGSADNEFMAKNNVKRGEFEGVVNQLLLTKGVKVAVFMYDKAPGVVKVSIRSKSDDYNVALVSAQFSGGGHVRAAGCDYNGTIKQAEEAIVAAITEMMERAE